MTSSSGKKYIPFALPDIGEEEIAEVVSALRSGWITSGPRVKQFEREFEVYTGAAYALAVNSCTAGLHLALTALGIGAGDEVITTPLTFCATVNSILETGADVVLADVGEDLNLDPEAVLRAITPRTKAILPVHMAGLPCAMGTIWQIAREHGLKVVEDAAHAAGASYDQARIGAGESDAVVFSFYATKNLATGEGGMVTTNSASLSERMRICCLHGISRDAWNRYTEQGSWYYEVVDRGFKYNMPDILAAVGIHQLRKLDRMNERRLAIAHSYTERFQKISELELPPDRPHSGHAWHLYILRLNLAALKLDRGQFLEEMRTRRIGCSVHFIPIPLHPYYRGALTIRDPCKRALVEYPRLVSLPLYSKMTDDDVKRVVEAVQDIVLRNSIQTVPFGTSDDRRSC